MVKSWIACFYASLIGEIFAFCGNNCLLLGSTAAAGSKGLSRRLNFLHPVAGYQPPLKRTQFGDLLATLLCSMWAALVKSAATGRIQGAG